MELFGLTIGRKKSLNPVDRGGWNRIYESFAGAWQQNVEVNAETALSYHAIFSCMTLIASDIAKMRVKLMAKDSDGIWSETSDQNISPLLNKPNSYQTRIQFWENWVLSKLARGNTYALKQRNRRGTVTGLYILEPARVRPMVSDDGAVWYELQSDNLAGLSDDQSIVVPADEIIHDRFNCLFHPLVGISPIYACGLAATQGLKIQQNSANFFGNGSKPGGILTAPGRIDPENAARLKEYWDQNFTGENVGKIAILGDGLKYEGMTVTATDAQLVEQLKWTAEIVCSTFHVPPYKLGIGQTPSASNVQALNLEYYTQCLQILIESIEICIDEGLYAGDELRTEFNLDGLLRMDSVTQMEVLEKSKSIQTLDERRAKLGIKPITGGNTVYLQQQDHSIEAIAARDAQLIAQANAPVEPPPVQQLPEPDVEAGKALLREKIRKLVNA